VTIFDLDDIPQEVIEQEFAGCGNLLEVRIKTTKDGRNFAIVDFAFEQNFSEALKIDKIGDQWISVLPSLDNKKFNNRKLYVTNIDVTMKKERIKLEIERKVGFKVADLQLKIDD